MLLFLYFLLVFFFFFKQKTAYEMRISDWSSDVCSSDLMIALRYEESGSTGVVILLRDACVAVNFDHEHGGSRGKISNVAADPLLIAELDSVEPLCSRHAPQSRFRLCRLAAPFLGALDATSLTQDRKSPR